MKRIYTIFLLSIAILIGCQMNTTSDKQEKIISQQVKIESFGFVDGKEVFLYTLSNSAGMQVKLTNYGGIVTSILVPDRSGNYDDVVLGFDKLEPYLDNKPYFGAIVGRYANRIAKGKFTLDSVVYELATNNGPNHLHGGLKGFDKRIWEAEILQQKSAVSLSYLSPDGEEGYPGNLKVDVIYTLTEENELHITYEATTDKATPVNLSHHSYFNLNGISDRSMLDHDLMIKADSYIYVDESLIPTGELRNVEGAMDFRKMKKIGQDIADVEGGFDHTYVLNKKEAYSLVATLNHTASGRIIEVFTTEPGMQFYSGNFLDGTITGKKGIIYQKHHGLCLETQHYPDSPNQPDFPNTILRPGEVYKQTTCYKFGVME